MAVSFTLTASKATRGWEDHIGEITELTTWKYADQEKREAANLSLYD